MSYTVLHVELHNVYHNLKTSCEEITIEWCCIVVAVCYRLCDCWACLAECSGLWDVESLFDLWYLGWVLEHVLEDVAWHVVWIKISWVHLVHVASRCCDIVKDTFAVVWLRVNWEVWVINRFFAVASEGFNLGRLALIVKAKSIAKVVLVHSFCLYIDQGVWENQVFEDNSGVFCWLLLVVIENGLWDVGKILSSKAFPTED